MLFGDKHEFGIESKITMHIDGYPVGHFRFWLKNQPIGDYSIETLLGTYATFLKDQAPQNQHANQYDFGKMADEQILDFLKFKLYGDSGGNLEEYATNEKIFRRFLLSPGIGEAMDDFFIAMVESEGRIKIIVGGVTNDFFLKKEISPKKYYKVVESFVSWIESNSK
jgi:hypothetical protein